MTVGMGEGTNWDIKTGLRVALRVQLGLEATHLCVFSTQSFMRFVGLSYAE